MPKKLLNISFLCPLSLGSFFNMANISLRVACIPCFGKRNNSSDCIREKIFTNFTIKWHLKYSVFKVGINKCSILFQHFIVRSHSRFSSTSRIFLCRLHTDLQYRFSFFSATTLECSWWMHESD